MSDCRKCAKFEECAVDEDCGLFVDKPMTNADRIVRMTPEELAEWIAKDLIEPGYDTYDRTYRRWLDWLKSPVEVDE